MDKVKEEKGVKLDTELDVDDLKNLVKLFKGAVKEYTGKDFPDSAWEQLWGGICAVFDSWMNERAILYRRMNQIPEEWGTAVNVQAMVYGNMGDNSATGVAFSRDAATGENIFNGEYLINAQGEDVVAGIRTPPADHHRRFAPLGCPSGHQRRGARIQISLARRIDARMRRAHQHRRPPRRPLQGHAGHGVHHSGR